jgi:hypothetical protein
MEKIAIYGAGGFGKDIAFLLETINREKPTYDFIGFFDDGVERGKIISNYPVLGNVEDLNNFPEDLQVVFAINGKGLVPSILSKITNKKVQFPNIAHPSCFIDFKSLKIGIGNVFNVNVIV